MCERSHYAWDNVSTIVPRILCYINKKVTVLLGGGENKKKY